MSALIRESWRLSFYEPQTYEVILVPAGLALYHRFQSFQGECIAATVRGYGHAPPIQVSVAQMRSGLANKIKAVAALAEAALGPQRANESARCA